MEAGVGTFAIMWPFIDTWTKTLRTAQAGVLVYSGVMSSLRFVAWVAFLLFVMTPPALARDKDERGRGSPTIGESEEEQDQGNRRKSERPPGWENVEIKITATPLDSLEEECVTQKAAAVCKDVGLRWKAGVAGYKSGKPDLRRAENFLRSGCYFGDAEACVIAAKMFLNAEAGIRLEGDGRISLDFGTAANLLDLGCRGGRLWACGMAGDLHLKPSSFMRNDDMGFHDLERDPIASRNFFETGCAAEYLPTYRGEQPEEPDVDVRSCARLGEFYAQGVTVRTDDTVALRYMQLACEVSDADHICDRAEDLLETVQEEEARRANRKGGVKDPDEDFVRTTTGRGTGALASARPDVSRFEDPSIGIQEEESKVRFEIEPAIGVRWVYGPATEPLFTLGAAIDLWFNFVAIAVDFSYSTDDLLRREARDYGRIQLAVLAKWGIPLPVPIPNARLLLVPGIGGHFGTRTVSSDGVAALQGGLVERVELRISTPQRRGARQWGAIRFEQQQSFVQYTFGAVEHASQVMFIFGFTFGGGGPELPKKDGSDAGEE